MSRQSPFFASWDGVASGTSFADALTGGAYMALRNGPLVLVDPAQPGLTGPAATVLWNHDQVLAGVGIFGGTGALSRDVSDNAAMMVASTGTPAAYTDHHVAF